MICFSFGNDFAHSSRKWENTLIALLRSPSWNVDFIPSLYRAPPVAHTRTSSRARPSQNKILGRQLTREYRVLSAFSLVTVHLRAFFSSLCWGERIVLPCNPPWCNSMRDLPTGSFHIQGPVENYKSKGLQCFPPLLLEVLRGLG